MRLRSFQLSKAHPVSRAYRWVRSRTGYVKGLDFLWLEITKSCNLACSHCYVSSGPGLPLVQRMQTEDWCRIMSDARSLGCREVQFIGGEPTVHPDLPRLLTHARQVGFWRSEVYTNATALSDELLDWFEALGVIVAFSFYSAKPEVHDRITRQKGSFEKTLDGLSRLSKRKIGLRAGFVVVDQDDEDLSRAKELLQGFGIQSMRFDRVRGVGRGERLVSNSTQMNELCGECWRGKLCVDPDGDAFPCVLSRFAPVGNVLDDGMGSIVKGDRLHTFRCASYVN